MTPLVAFTIVVIIVFAPLSIGASRFMYGLYREDVATSTDPQRIRLSLVLMLMVVAATVAGWLLAASVVLFLAGSTFLRRELVLVSIDILLPLGTIVAGYLRWRRGR